MPQSQRQDLSGSDALLLLEAIRACVAAERADDLHASVYPRIRELFAFDYAAASLGTWRPAERRWSQRLFLNFGLPDAFWSQYAAFDWIADPVVAECLRGRPHQHWSMTAGQTLLDTGETRRPPHDDCSRLWMDQGVFSGYTSTVAPAAADAPYGVITFCTQGDRAPDPRIRTILAHLMPHLHQALIRAADMRDRQTEAPCLSARERDVLDWLRAGKSSWEIAMLLGIGERTVNFHVYNLMRKLGAANRPQAVAIAAGRGLIEID